MAGNGLKSSRDKKTGIKSITDISFLVLLSGCIRFFFLLYILVIFTWISAFGVFLISFSEDNTFIYVLKKNQEHFKFFKVITHQLFRLSLFMN